MIFFVIVAENSIQLLFYYLNCVASMPFSIFPSFILLPLSLGEQLTEFYPRSLSL